MKDKNGKTMYRVGYGTFEHHDQAEDMCYQFEARGVSYCRAMPKGHAIKLGHNTNGVLDCLSGLFNPAALWIHADKAGFPISAAVGGRDDYDALPLRGLSRTSEDLRQARRLLSLACVYDGMSRADAAKGGGAARQSPRDRVLRFNEAGPEGAVRPPGPAAPMAGCDPNG